MSNRPRIPRPSRHGAGEQGLTLIESLIATAVLLVVAIAVVPLFSRAMLNNRSGFDSNEASHLVRSELEDALALEFNNPRFDFRNPPPGTQPIQPSTVGTSGHEMLYADLFWDQGAAAPGVGDGTPKPWCNVLDGGTPKTLDGLGDCVKLGDGGWITDPDQAKGVVVWQRRSVFRQYTYADISEGVIDQAGVALVSLGHAHFFDAPLETGDPATSGHFNEHTVELKNERGDATLSAPQLGETTLPLGPGSQRSRVFRTF